MSVFVLFSLIIIPIARCIVFFALFMCIIVRYAAKCRVNCLMPPQGILRFRGGRRVMNIFLDVLISKPLEVLQSFFFNLESDGFFYVHGQTPP